MKYRIMEQTRPGGLVEQVYREVLAPAFPAEELESESGVTETLEAGLGSLLVAVDEAGRPAGAAFGRWSEASRVQLLAYLAVKPGTRGHGLGGRLLRDAIEAWRERYDPCAIVAEVESPDAPTVHEAYGDPRRRLAFYEAAGARVLDLPYFQPGIGSPSRRVRGMLLLVLHADPSFTQGRPDRLSGRPLRTFMEAYLESAEGARPTDWDARTLFEAIDREGGIPMGRTATQH
ncbi:GNAT family N-acetyltransferase [Glycomyces tritici]|uniref:GNAT family N-acetyltransferase n=1 Tax=Glycomyces tritici TaxID=2665176 RepID=A0ABT7YXF4_9ACTN|nr:GNAT family N-acetyltransferase [Glycomyces tritici]MDN3241316.1 GNAT family N-acetyltransferase [Glycomyces tritici]MDN3243339.1 GNAT family N-acetyltransferase [Glycomyces tritici]